MDTKALRQKILDLAIHGKLVPQDPNDEPASVLLERIKAEKERLIKEGKIKRSKKSAKSSDTPHYPYLLPNGWEWCNLEDIVCELKYGTSEKSLSVGKIAVLRMGNITNVGTIDYSNLVYSSNNEDIKLYSLEKDDLLFNRTNSSEWVGKTAIYKKEQPAIYAGYLIRIRPILIFSDYLNTVMNSSYYRNWCYNVKTDAVNQSNINAQKLSQLMIPIPPLKEQERIVVEVAKWISLINTIKNSKEDLQTTIKQAKSKILNLAIHGKLVPQDPNDEPAIELLKRINPDFTPCDNGHYTFDVPSGWITTNLGSIFNVVSAKRILKSDWKHSGVPFYRAREIAKLSIYGLVDNELYISEEHYNSLKEKFPVPKASDIMISAVGTIGKCYIVKESDKFYYKDASVLCLCNDYQINAKYIYHIMRSEYMLKQMYDNSKGTTVDTITIEKAKQYILPLPPLAEQQRIVAKIEETFSIFDGIQN
ncbi:restriction endonuclease subunit S [Phocaeicola vulgatus]|jgi:type I restriction enzyme S subunit|uniref:Restriction endonuclease subunit S n=2 Tax=Phocaeicola vulgatus TaxID=821 RepID=A0AAE8A722_PHOVU|nr:restriction endonuclease subunit S [Phocaeicola vulgatus]KAB3683641.1 restriction endonuclease subunit S [Phocaeicola vulgatus]MCE8860584.1 restriction endonuclease subunit S [Phocaeicola vulgatus]MCS2317317.1 restriction endonuclease subunit S [Phocaeicola vulgatus]MDB0991332.1 restriction endonuclease subunit S [Phocaeicola vulgatus]MDB1056209.1 restriction endonuclease subunit S [Phocaeicola vulgatus]